MSAQPSQVLSLPVSYDAYIRHGWSLVPIPPNTKGPRQPGWNKKENALNSSMSLPPEWGVGLAHAYSGTMALDIDDWDTAMLLLGQHGIDLKALYDAPDAVQINSGNPGHGKLIYAMPFGLVLPSKKITHNHLTVFELRCATNNHLTVQDVLPPTRHPSGTTYQWGGRGNWQRLPMLPTEILTLWQSLVDRDTQKVIKVSGTVDASWEEIQSALHSISPDCSRDDWIACGMALHDAGHHTNQLDFAYQVWDEWSQQSATKYDPLDIPNQWRSFKPDGGVTLGSLFHLAQEAGWKRTMPDVTHLFADITPVKSASLIDGMVTPPPMLNLDLIPDVLRSRAHEVSVTMSVDPLVPIFAGLAAVCAAADARIRLRLMADWKMPPVMWLMTVGSPSTKKTPGVRPMIEPLLALEKEHHPIYKDELLRFEALDACYAASKKAHMDAAKDADFLMGGQDTKTLPPVAAQPDKPVPLRFIVSDITSQKLVRMAADRPRGILAYLDETKTWADRMTDKASPENRGTWVKGYNAERETLDRVGDGKAADNSVVMDNFAVSILANIQPRVIKSHIAGLTADGLLQRFIFCILRDEYSEKKNDPRYPQTTSDKWENVIRQIYALPVMQYELSPEAFTIFRNFQDWHITLKRDERIIQSSDAYIDAIGKVDGLCGRLALVYHLLTNPYNPYVQPDTVNQACELVKSYIVPSIRYVLGDIGGIESGSLDHWITNHILYLAGEQTHVTLSELKRSARRQLEKVSPYHVDATLIESMTLLEQAGWLSMIESNKKTTLWAINPAIVEIDKEGKQAAIDSRQRIYDHIHKTSGGKAPRRIAKGYMGD